MLIHINLQTLTKGFFQSWNQLILPILTYTPEVLQGLQPLTKEDANNELAKLTKLGLSILPAAPLQDAEKYPKLKKDGTPDIDKETGKVKPLYTGKNPSYLDSNNEPTLIAHSKYHAIPPTVGDMNLWFSNPKNGIGALGNDQYIAITVLVRYR